MEVQRDLSPCPADLDKLLEEIECLARSQNRLCIMYVLNDSPATLTELHETLGVHRTTLGRNITELKRKNWVSSSPAESLHHITTEGEMMIIAFDEVIRTTRDVKRLGSFLSRVPEAIPVNKEHLDTVRITCPEFGDPLASMSRLFELLEDHTSIQGFVPVLGPHEGRVIVDQISEDTNVTLVLPQTTCESLGTNHPQLFTPLREAGNTDVCVSEEIPSYGLFLLDEIVVLLAYDDDMRIHSILETAESQVIIGWAKKEFENRYARATPGATVL